jgi:pimeloyl-ACP methyl ester carboxylesterase
MSFPSPRMIDLPVGRVAYRRAGEGSPLLLIHGWGASSRYWLGAFTLLAERHDLIAVDLPGFGESPPGRGPTNLATLTATVLELCEALGLDQAAVAGHSLGGGVAMLLAAHRPALVRRLALVSFGLPRSTVEAAVMGTLHMQLTALTTLWAPWLAFWAPWFAAARPMRTAAWTSPPLPVFLAAPMVRQLPEIPYAALALGAVDLAAMDARAGVEAASTSGDPAVMAAARLVSMPTLVISGAEDPLFPAEAAQALVNAMPNAGLVLLEGCGHVPMAETPAAFYATLKAFVAP